MLILAGIAINAFSSALTSGALFLSNEKLSSIVFWLMGGFWKITYQDCLLLSTSLVIGLGILLYFHKEMDLMLLGDRSTLLLGVNLTIFKPLVLFSIAILSASSVCCAGIIGFVGLAIPHIVRLFGITRFRLLLFQSAIGGALLLLIADLIARYCFAPLEIPVGILTSLLGGPFFFYLLLKNKGSKL
jgi:iron complex transport system permease protein